MFEVFQPDFDTKDYYVVTYRLGSTKSLEDAAWNLAIGQSVGNPNVRNAWESDELFAKHSCIVLEKRGTKKMKQHIGTVKIAFPMANINIETDGVSQVLCQIMGGQLDIDSITKCQVLDIEFPETAKKTFLGPKFGIEGFRNFTKTYDKPFLGGIVKPKVCMNEDILLDLVKALVEGGVNFIKEDEIMSDPSCCPLERRVPKLAKYIQDKNVVYCFCINSDPHNILDRVKFVHQEGGNGVHVNFWSGFGVYNSIRKLDLPLFLHFQKSGDKILTGRNHAFNIDWRVICKLTGMMGVDTAHAGMVLGYSNDPEEVMNDVIKEFHSHGTIPALSCGMHPGLVEKIRSIYGNDLMLSCGGSIHGHSLGTKAGAKAMRQAIDRTNGEEYDIAISQWGIVK